MLGGTMMHINKRRRRTGHDLTILNIRYIISSFSVIYVSPFKKTNVFLKT
jgi:hypothetical protein